MKAQDFENGLQQVASEMKLTKNIFTSATKEQLEFAAKACNVEEYNIEVNGIKNTAHFLLKDGRVIDCVLYQNDNEVNISNYDLNQIYSTFKNS